MVRGRAVALLLIVVVVLVGGWIVFSTFGNRSSQGATNEARKAADSFVLLLADKNADATYDTLSSTYKESMSRDTWKEWVEFTFKDLDGKPSFDRELPIEEAGNVYGENTTPVRYVYSFTVQGQSYKMPFVFINEDGTWKSAEIGSPIQ